ncbi:MAG: hypothetical protein DCF32_06940 [Leptolyngbya sp.]|nr:MAG: hypothetical protein DCF32_06940 [Leptolyngbya sp.]
MAHFNQAIELAPNSGGSIYNKACCYAIQSDVDNAISCLQSAIALDSRYRTMAKTDTDFDPVRADEQFQSLVEKSEE